MSRLKEIMEQENFEKDVKALICEFKGASRVSNLMNPSLAAWNDACRLYSNCF